MVSIKIAFIIAVAVSFCMEWLKNMLPTSVKENKYIMSGISGVLSILSGVLYCLYEGVTPITKIVVFSAIVLAFVQGTYELCVKTAVAIQTKLKSKTTIDADSIADDVVDKVVDFATKGVEEITKKS